MEAEGIEAGIIQIATCFDRFQDIIVNGKTWCPIAVDRGPTYILKAFLAFREIFSQIRERAAITKVVSVSVGGYLVPAGVDFLYQMGEAFGDPAEDEEGCTRPCSRFNERFARGASRQVGI